MLDDRKIKESSENSNNYNSSNSGSYDSGATDDKLCSRYRDRLKKYRSQGVTGINPITGRTGKITGQAKKDLIEDAQQNVSLFCN